MARADPPERLTIRGGFLIGLAGAEATAVVDDGDPSGAVQTGQACCAGVVTARVRVVSDPRVEALEAGEILVARHTDPGWIAVFANASGVIAERGSLLSHFRLFRTRLLPLVHGRETIEGLLAPREIAARADYYDRRWNNLRWRMLLKTFFSKTVMGRLGRDPAFFDHAEGSASDQVARNTRQALVDQDPSRNPYLAWILTGTHGDALPLALRPEHFDVIRERIERLEVRLSTIEALAEQGVRADAFNLSDIFEYMSPAAHEAAYRSVLDCARPGARIAYWNMMAPRRAPASLADRITSDRTLEASLRPMDKAFFYSDFVVETVR